MSFDRRRAGFTLIEMVISVTVLAGLVLMVTNTTLSVRASQELSSGIAASSEAGRGALDALRVRLSSAVFLPQNNTAGNAYLSMMDMTDVPARIQSRLPTIDETGIFRKEPIGGTVTGNILFFARHQRTDTYEAASSQRYRIPIYRFHLFYLSRQKLGPDAKRPYGLELCHWVSEPLADGEKIDRIPAGSDLDEVLLHLSQATPDVEGHRHPPVQVAWMVGEDPYVTGTLRSITAGALSALPPSGRGPSWTILRGLRRRNVQLLGHRRLSIATNFAPRRFGVARFGDKTFTGEGFPHGFEVQIIGSSSARKVLVSLSVVEVKAGDKLAFFRQHVVASTPQGVTL